MIEISLGYMNKLASQMQFISALLCGFSLTVMVLLFEKKASSKIIVNIFRCSILATGAFLVSIFAMTNIFMMTTEGFPFQFETKDLVFPRIMGMISFLIGIVSIMIMIALFGWTKSRNLGLFSTAIGVTTLILVLMMLT